MADANENRHSFRFSLLEILYAVAVIGSSLGLMGWPGLFAAAVVLVTWWQIFREWPVADARVPDTFDSPTDQRVPKSTVQKNAFTLLELLVVIAIIGILVALLLPAVRRGGSRRHWYIHEIGLALRNYSELHGELPPPVLFDKAQNTKHSWRVLILPQLGRQDLYDAYRFDESWDSPHNLHIAEEMPRVFRLGQEASKRTSIRAIVGDGTAWELGRVTTSTDSTAHQRAFLLCECERDPILWTSPVDVDANEAIRLLTQEPQHPHGKWHSSFFTARFDGRMTLSASIGLARVCTEDTSLLQPLVRVTDSDEPEKPSYRIGDTIYTTKLYGNWIRLSVFVLVVLLPIGWLPKRKERGALAD